MVSAARCILVGLAAALAACSGDETSAPVNAGPSEATPLTIPAAGLTTIAPATEPTTTIASATTAPATEPTTTTTAGPAAEYAAATPPLLPEHSSPPPAADTFPDGAYYGVVKAPALEPSPHLTLTIYEMLSGPSAIAAATADGVGLDSDFYVRSMSSAERVIGLGPPVAISVAQPDDPDTSYTVSGAELVRLVQGGAPAADAPPNYHYVGFPFLVTVEAGTPTRVEQLWSP